MRDRIARHQAPRTFGMEADDLVSAAFPVFEHTFDDTGLERLAVDGLEVFLRRQVDHHGGRVGAQAGGRASSPSYTSPLKASSAWRELAAVKRGRQAW